VEVEEEEAEEEAGPPEAPKKDDDNDEGEEEKRGHRSLSGVVVGRQVSPFRFFGRGLRSPAPLGRRRSFRGGRGCRRRRPPSFGPGAEGGAIE